MTSVSYSVSVKERIASDQRFQAEFAAQWAPMQGFRLARAVFAIAICTLIIVAIPDLHRAFIVLAAAWLLFWSFCSANEKLTSHYYQKYLNGLPGIEEHRTFFEGDYLVTENRRIRVSLPLQAVTKVFTDDDCLFVEFGDLGNTRVPLSAFPSEADRLEFERAAIEKSDA